MNFKIYQFKKTKLYLKNNNLLFFSNGINQTSKNWVKIEQGLQKLKLIYYKSYNKLTLKILLTSIFLNFDKIVSGPFFFLKPDQNFFEKYKIISFLENFKSLFFSLLAIKVNNKIYSLLQINNINSFKYKSSIILLYQFLTVNLKNLIFVKLIFF